MSDLPLLDRRDFLIAAGSVACGACLGFVPPALAGDRRSQPLREVDHYRQLGDGMIQCFVCPLNCVLKPGQTCFCRTRANIDGRLYTRAYSNPCILREDPIEKLPLNHFRPGSRTLTLGVGGCNLRCLYCQNWQQSQRRPEELRNLSLTPKQVVAAVRKRRIDTIAFSYTEPVAFLEYALDTAKLAKKAGLKVVVATAAYINPEPLLEFAQYVDAFSLALKGFDDEFYYRALGVRLEPVLTAIETLATRGKSWIEIVNLVVPTYNDDERQIARMCAWLSESVGAEVPVHFARFVPMYRLTNLPRTPVQTLEAACRIAEQHGLKYVYTSNIAPHEKNNTFCGKCGTGLIERLGFRILSRRDRAGRCPKCHTRLPGVWR